jgi:YfiH family protein
MNWPIEPSPLGRIVVAPHVPPGFAGFYTTRELSGRLDEREAARITGFVESRFGIEAALVTCTQVHGAGVEEVTAAAAWRECQSRDALWTDRRGVAIGIKIADCLPVSLIDSDHHLTANIHSGWRSTVQRIVAATVDEMRENASLSPGRACAWLGPAIRQCCFEVGEEVVSAFQASFGDVTSFVDRGRSKPHLDIPGLTRHLLLQIGFNPERIFDSGLCTRCDGSIFHSFRRDGRGCGRNLAIVAH